MTLLELLRQELPKRGGWPEGAVKATSYGLIPGVHFWDDNDFRVDYSDLTTRALGEGLVTREQYEATGWDGTGLPPVGMKVEWLSDKYGWLGGTVAAHDAKYPLIAIIRHNDGYTGCHRHELRTEAECAIDEMVRLSGVSTGAAKILYDAGYRK